MEETNVGDQTYRDYTAGIEKRKANQGVGGRVEEKAPANSRTKCTMYKEEGEGEENDPIKNQMNEDRQERERERKRTWLALLHFNCSLMGGSLTSTHTESKQSHPPLLILLLLRNSHHLPST